jgi:isopentenyl-diphosphate delta-isomerase
MTGGSEEGGRINRILAEAAARTGVGMGLGSQRAMIEHPELAATYDLRAMAPEVPLVIGNIGAVQLNHGVGAAELRGLFEAVSMDALAFHLNPLQEAIQPEGDTDFRGILDKLDNIVPLLDKPCVIKEVGTGISARTAEKLAGLPVAGVEAAGVGGTSWALVEARRAGKERSRDAGTHLAWFGVETAQSIQHCRDHFGDRVVIGSGGIQTGLQAAAAIALGADAVAVTAPLLVAAREGVEAVTKFLDNLVHELRIVMFCTGARTVADLRRVRYTTERG